MRLTGVRKWTIFLVPCLLAVFCYCAPADQRDTGSDVAIVVNENAPVSNLDMGELRKIFLGDRQYWTPDLPVIVIVRGPGSHERDVVLRVIYQMSELEFKRYWIAKIFRAEAVSAPKIVYSDAITNELVTAMPGAIGFVAAHDVTKGEKVVRIDGHLPGDPEYVLR
ncbi:MAG TPA: substrate-binding domain-containing protein [Candidatus Acidoferrum sp.]|nr:substrate-binding domain-containing protein [Candidatus Acidoferrum sp.]